MRIERVEIYGFRGLSNKKILFDRDKANLLIEPNEFGKTTIAEAICAALFGFKPRDMTTEDRLSALRACEPIDGSSYKVAMDIAVQGRRTRIVRDFRRGTVAVFDLDNASKEITDEFLVKKGDYQVGQRLLGLSLDQFLKTCFVAQSALDKNNQGADLTQVLQKIADSSAGEHTVAEAIHVLNSSLSPFAHAKMGKSINVDTEIKRLTDRLQQIDTELTELQHSRDKIEPEVHRVLALEEKIGDAEVEQRKAEYMALKAELEELDRTINQQAALQKQQRTLAEESGTLAAYADFPSTEEGKLIKWIANLESKQPQLDQAERQGRRVCQTLSDLARLRTERFASFNGITEADYERITWLAEDLVRKTREYDRVSDDLKLEADRVGWQEAQWARFYELDNAFASLDVEQRTQLAAYNERRLSLANEMTEHNQAAAAHEQLIGLIEAARMNKRKNGRITLAVGVVLAIVSVLVAVALKSIPASAVLALIGAACLVVGLWMHRSATSHREHERSESFAELEKNRKLAEERQLTLSRLEEPLQTIAQRLGFPSVEELVTAYRQHAQLSIRLQTFRKCAQQRDLLEKQRNDTVSQIKEFFKRVGRPDDVSEPSVRALRTEAKDYLNLLREERRSKEGKDQCERMVAELKQEVRALESDLRRTLAEARIAEYINFSDALRQYRKAVEKRRRYESLCEELARTRREIKGERELESLRERRTSLSTYIAQAESEDPALLELRPTKAPGAYVNEANSVRHHIGLWKDEIATIRQKISYTLQDFESRYARLLLERQEMTKTLAKAEKFKSAVELARGVFENLSVAIHRHWAEELNKISSEMLTKLQTDYEEMRFDSRLHFTVRVKGNPAPLQSHQINSQLSTGTQDQLWLLARLAIGQYLARGCMKPPLILDDPFITSDDGRFKNLMEFIIDKLSSQCQVILLTCHQVRHQWLRSQLPDLFASRVRICRLEEL